MIEKKIRIRKEVVRCDICKQPKDFWYLSDFAYGQRLIYFDNNINPAHLMMWFDEPGGGIQYKLPDTVDELLDAEIIR